MRSPSTFAVAFAFVFALALGLAAAPRAARADQAGHEAQWYGWQLMIADAASVTLIFGSAAIQAYSGSDIDDAWLAVPLATWAAAPAVIHLGHGEGWSAAGSVGLRVGLP